MSAVDWFKKSEQAQVTFEEGFDKIMPATTTVTNKLNGIGLEKIEVESELKMNAFAGVEANYKITLTWERGGG